MSMADREENRFFFRQLKSLRELPSKIGHIYKYLYKKKSIYRLYFQPKKNFESFFPFRILKLDFFPEKETPV